MMLYENPFYQPNHYLPARPSPLAERTTNVPPFRFTMTAQQQEQSHEQKKAVVAPRLHKPNPVIQSRDAATQRRRDMFFRRVRNERNEKKWEARGEQIQRLDWVSEQKRWEAEKARQAPELKDEYIESLMEDVAAITPSTNAYSQQQAPPEQHMTEEEYILAQEEYELQALIAAMEEQQNSQDNTTQHYGSDEEDYDQLFMECMNDGSAPSGLGDPDAMDMTDG